MKQIFNTGDIVQLKSGSPAMTISLIEPINDSFQISCIWFRGGKVQREVFSQETVGVYVEPDYPDFFMSKR